MAEEKGYGSIPPAEDQPPAAEPPSLQQACVAELMGTTALVLVGCGGLCVGLYMGHLTGMWQVAGLWVLGATIGLYNTASISGGHINPAVTLSFALVRPGDFSFKKLLPYWVAQLLGGMLAGLFNLMIFHEAIARYETKAGLTRGDADSIQSAATFGDYYSLSKGVSGPFHAFFIEAFGTGFLTFTVFAITNSKNNVPPAAVPVIVGLAIGSMVALLGSLTGAGINPARDLGPRLVTLMAGWGTASMTDMWVYIVGPFVGGPIGAFLADRVLMADW